MKMVGNTLIAALMISTVAVVCSNPLHQPEQSNIPQCAQPKVSGMCLAYFPSYYYNPGTESCESFIYGGCQGNQNRFSTEEECMSTCGGFKLERKDFTLRPDYDQEDLVEKSQEESSSTEDPCSLKQEMGPCRASMDRFYFNGDDCERFIYGGCQGNKNNFKTVEECRQKCHSSSAEVDSSENETKDLSEEKSEEKTEE